MNFCLRLFSLSLWERGRVRACGAGVALELALTPALSQREREQEGRAA